MRERAQVAERETMRDGAAASTVEDAAGRVDDAGLAVAAGGIAWLRLPSPGGVTGPAGTFARALDRALDDVDAAVAAGRARALVIRTEVRGDGSADLRALLGIASEAEATAAALAGQASLLRLEALAVPSVAAIEGPCTGAALELALACSYRVASLSRATRFSLPQLRLGLIPALGGSVRLPRLIGVDAALRLILRDQEVGAASACAMGLVDLAVPAPELEERVTAFALERVERGRIRTGARRRIHRRLVEDTAPGRRILFARAARHASERLPASAVSAALRSVADGISLPLERAFLREAELFGQLVVGDAARSLVHAALLEGQALHPHLADGRAVERVAVLGARAGGIELATLLARRGYAIRIKDRERGLVAASVQRLRERLSEAGSGAAERVEGTVGFGGFGVMDLVIAAPDPGPDAVVRALAEVEEHTPDGCLLASASPLLSLERLASEVRDASRALGLVSARPAELFPIVEIVSGAATHPDVLAAACGVVRALGRTPVHVADGPGFVVHRLLAVLLVEATRLVHEGATVHAVDSEMEDFGFAMGPLRRIDAIGVAGTILILEALSETLGPRVGPNPVLRWLADRDATLYHYRKGRVLGVNPELPARSVDAPVASERIRERLLLALSNESARILDEGVAASAADVDLAAIFGLGYPRGRGGLLFQADLGGLAAARDRLTALAEMHGETYRPSALLSRLATAGEGFYPARSLSTGQAPG